MDCARVAREEILEAYLVGRLNEEDRQAFEEHYFECAGCFDELQTLQAIQGELRSTGAEVPARTSRPLLAWAPIAGLAAAVVVAVGAVLWLRPAPGPRPLETARTPPASQAPSPERPIAQQPGPSVASEPSLEQLARIEPPRYEPPTFRGAPDEATARFQRGMEHYRKTDYARAVDELRGAFELDHDAPHIAFFLGISELMAAEDGAAIVALRRTIELGDSAYLEDAHWYLAKAFIRRKDLDAAGTHLKTLIQLRGARSGEARRLLTQLERLTNRSQ